MNQSKNGISKKYPSITPETSCDQLAIGLPPGKIFQKVLECLCYLEMKRERYVRSTARHAIYLQFDISALKSGTKSKLYSLMCC
jgi:hypothetical protein